MRTKIQVTTRTSAEIDALCDAVFKSVKPLPPAKPLTVADKFAPYRKAIMKQRRRGLNWDQIAAGLNDPRIAENASAKTLKRLFGGPKPKPNKAFVPARLALPVAARPVPPKPPVHRLILDPATGKPIT